MNGSKKETYGNFNKKKSHTMVMYRTIDSTSNAEKKEREWEIVEKGKNNTNTHDKRFINIKEY